MTLDTLAAFILTAVLSGLAGLAAVALLHAARAVCGVDDDRDGGDDAA